MKGAGQDKRKVESGIGGEISTVRDLEGVDESVRVTGKHLDRTIIS